MHVPALRPILALSILAAAAAPGTGAPVPLSRLLAPQAAVTGPALIATNHHNIIEYWPIAQQGGSHPAELAKIHGLTSPQGMVANGQVLAIANRQPDRVVLYDVAKATTTMLPDAGGSPADIAIDRSGTLYVLNTPRTTRFPNIAMYRTGSTQPALLFCHLQYKYASGIAVDNEGDIFIQQFNGVIEIPRGPGGPDAKSCRRLRLPTVSDFYPSGITVEPKSDALIVIGSDCAGGTGVGIFPKPYGAVERFTWIPANCAFRIRLDATSELLYVGDTNVDGSGSFIRQYAYPDGKYLGTYSGGSPSSITTIPNALPN
jgi:hypothetical protein